jgi:polyadenylation factor subunit 2
VLTGSKDKQCKIWDVVNKDDICTLHVHNQPVTKVRWSPCGNYVATGSIDNIIEIFDVRMQKEVQKLQSHNKEICSLLWHPSYPEMLISAGKDSIIYWLWK